MITIRDNKYTKIKKTEKNFKKAICELANEYEGSPLTKLNQDRLKNDFFELLYQFVNIKRSKISFRLGLTKEGTLEILFLGELDRMFSPFRDEDIEDKDNYDRYVKIF